MSEETKAKTRIKKWKTIRANGITVASGYECPECGLISPAPVSCSCTPQPQENNG